MSFPDTVGAVLQDLEITPFLDACVLSEEEGVEKPDSELWRRAIRAVVQRKSALVDGDDGPSEEIGGTAGFIPTTLGKDVLHVGDELDV